MYTIGVVAYTERELEDVAELEKAFNRLNYPVHIEQMGIKLQPAQLGDYYYEENAILLWLCRCYGNRERCLEAIECYLEGQVDILLVIQPPALEALLSVGGEANIPVVFTRISKSRYEHLRACAPQATFHISGVFDTQMELVEERAALLTEIVPTPRVIHTFYNPESPESQAELERLSQASTSFGLNLFPYAARTPNEVKDLLSRLKTGQDHALFRLADGLVDPVTGLIGAVAHEQYIPYIGCYRDEVESSGALLAIQFGDTYKQAVAIIDRILHGSDPAAIPMVEPAEKNLCVNLQTTQDLGLILSPALLKRAQVTIPAKELTSFRFRLMWILLSASIILSVLTMAAYTLGALALFSVTFLTAIGFSVFLWVYLNRRIIRPLKQLTVAAEKIGAGDLSTPILEVKGEEEVGALGRALRRTKGNLRDSYTDLEQMARSLEVRVEELTEANRALRQAQHELEIAGRRIIDAEDNSRFSLTTYIHDEILGPLDDLTAAAVELNDPDLQNMVGEIEKRVRRVRFDLSVPILQDLEVELRRLIQETLPLIYPNARTVAMNLNLTALAQVSQLEPPCIFLLYRFVRGAVSNAYRHAQASQISVRAGFADNRLSIAVTDNGHGFDLQEVNQFVMSGHYFFHDIHIRARQLKGTFRVEAQPGGGARLEVTVPVKPGGKGSGREATRRQGNRPQ